MIHYPKTVYIGITDKCNANCIMCWRRFLEAPHIDIDQILLEELMPFLENVEHIGWWSAGEIFAYSDIEYLINMMKKLDRCTHFFCTNGMGLYQYIDQLVNVNIGSIELSLDGSTSTTMDKIRCGVNLENVIDGILELRKRFYEKHNQEFSIRILTIIMKSNIDEICDIVRLSSKIGANEIFLNPLIVHNVELDKEVVQRDEAMQVIRKAIIIGDELGIKVGCTGEYLL